MTNTAKRRYVKQGNVIVVKQDLPNEELSPKMVLEALQAHTGVVERIKQQNEQMKQQLEKNEQALKDRDEIISELKKHESWAREVQVAKMESLIAEVVEECKLKILKGYDYDVLLTPEQNCIQLAHQLNAEVGRHPKIAEAVAPTIISEYIFTKRVVGNPWKELKEEIEVKALLTKAKA